MGPTELRELAKRQLTAPLEVAFEAIHVGETAGRQAYTRGELPFRVIKVGRCLRVPVADLVRLLLPDMDEAGDRAPAHVTTALRPAGPPARLHALADPLEIDNEQFTPPSAA